MRLLHLSLVLIIAGALTTHFRGIDGEITLPEGEAVPCDAFSLRLESFTIERYANSGQPKDYRSIVWVTAPGKDSLQMDISMNCIGRYEGWRFYQADYGEDLKSSILAYSRDPWGIGLTYAGYLLAVLGMILYLFRKKSAWKSALKTVGRAWPASLGGIIAFLLVGLTVWMSLKYGAKEKAGMLMPVLNSPLLIVHVVSMMVCYSLFGIIALNGIAGLVAGKRPLSQKLRDVSYSMLCPAVFILAFGIMIGAVWANISWGCYWSWDPKETWALITLIVYSVALHGTTLKPFRKPAFFHIWCILGVLFVLITWFGVNYFMGGMHSYA